MAKASPPTAIESDSLRAAAVWIGKAIYLVIALALLVGALALIGISFWSALTAFQAERAATFVLLDAVGMTVLGLAIVDVSKYLLEEEVLRDRELRSTAEARGALTKFLTIITIVVSLEAVILIFETSRGDTHDAVVYPVMMFAAVVGIVVALGLYQYLSAKAQQAAGSQAAIEAEKAERDAD
jgi:hypothetical protein